MKDEFIATLRAYLKCEGVEEALVKLYIEEGSEIVISKTNNRSVLGTMKEIAFYSENDFKENIDRLKWINQIIYKPIDYQEPIQVFKEALKQQYQKKI